ncbi:hypothetical protein D3C72_2190510 [compost metagenome]
MKHSILHAEQCYPGSWRDVVPLKRLVASVVGKRVGHAQGIDEIVDSVVLA